MIISIAAMAGVAIADDLKVTPMNLPCDKPDQMLMASIRSFSGVLKRHRRLERVERFRVYMRISRHNYRL
ncbi:hypothetical protein BDR05DRAFT_1063770 [Suillus weaverae]|nr:hypothetical protein BDR05DRAFT_1063770 [Suillus weaverae]